MEKKDEMKKERDEYILEKVNSKREESGLLGMSQMRNAQRCALLVASTISRPHRLQQSWLLLEGTLISIASGPLKSVLQNFCLIPVYFQPRLYVFRSDPTADRNARSVSVTRDCRSPTQKSGLTCWFHSTRMTVSE